MRALALIGLASLATGNAPVQGARPPEPRFADRAQVTLEAEPNDTPASATPIPAGGQHVAMGIGSIGAYGDEDYWTFVACSGCDVSILVDTGGLSYGSSRNSVVELYAFDGTTLLETDDNGGLGTGGDLTAESSQSSLIAGRRLDAGRHFVRVRAATPNLLIAPYRLVIAIAGRYEHEGEPNGTPGTARLLSMGIGVVGTLSSAADVDYFVDDGSLASPRCVFVNGDHLQTGTSTAVVLDVLDSNDNLLLTVDSASDPGGRAGQAVCFPTVPFGQRYRVRSPSGATGFYSIYFAHGRRARTTRIDFLRTFRSDLAIWRPSTGNWHVLRALFDYDPTAALQFQWGAPGDVPVAGDYDGDGHTDAAVFRPATGAWYVRRSTNPASPLVVTWGQNGDLPKPRDYDGDGLADFAVWRPSTGQWFVLKSSRNYATTMTATWGMAGDVPIPDDHDGDGRADFAVWRPSNGGWYRLSSNGGKPMPPIQFGQSGDIPVPLSIDASFTLPFIFRPSNGAWYNSNLSWGTAGDFPALGDYWGTGREAFGVWRPSTGVWYLRLDNGAALVRQWGTAGDVPIVDAY